MTSFMHKVEYKLRNIFGIYDTSRSTPFAISLPEIEKFLPVDPIVVEAGAYIGEDTLNMARRWRKATIYAFEPVPSIFAMLQKNTEKMANIHLFSSALSDTVGTQTMYISSGHSIASSSLLAPKDHLVDHPDTSFEQRLEVPTTTLLAWQKANQVERIDFLWLDMQGHELNMLKASTESLATVKAIYTEVNLKETYEGVPLYAEMKEWMQAHGFRVQHEAKMWADQGNVLFTR